MQYDVSIRQCTRNRMQVDSHTMSHLP